MKTQTQVFQLLTIGFLVFGMAVLGSRLNAQQTSNSPVAAQPQAQEPQAQQPAQQPGQEYPAGQQPQQPQQSGTQKAPDAQSGQPQGVQTFTGMIVKSGDKYVLQDSATGTTYDIDHQDEVGKHVGRKVQVTGTLDPSGKIIHLQPSQP
jgi:Protein of unknown function (DUF5818)